MGQAIKRGTFEQRKASAIERNNVIVIEAKRKNVQITKPLRNFDYLRLASMLMIIPELTSAGEEMGTHASENKDAQELK